MQGTISVHGGAVHQTRLPAIQISDYATAAVQLQIRDLLVEDVATAPSLCDGSVGCTHKSGYPPGALNVPVSLLWRPDHRRSWDQGSISIAGLTVLDTVARPWLQVMGQPGWHDLAIQANVTNPHGCAHMLEPNITAWKGASGLVVHCRRHRRPK